MSAICFAWSVLCIGAMSTDWKSAAGHAKFVRLFEHPDCRFELADEAKSFSWWRRHFKLAKTLKFPYECRECGFKGSGTSMENFLRTGRAKCMCKKSAQVSRYPTKEFHKKFLRIVSQIPRCDAGPLRNFARWASTVRSSHQHITLTCNVCEMRNSKVKLYNFMAYGAFGCFCTGHFDSSSEEARQYTLRVLQRDDHPFLPGPGVSSARWWKKNVTSSLSKIEVVCAACKKPTWTSLSHFLAGRLVGCGCRWDTETLVAKWFSECVCERD